MLDHSPPPSFAFTPRGTQFMLPEPPQEVDGRECWDKNLVAKYEDYLRDSGNRGVLTGRKRFDYRHWLQNPTSLVRGDTREERA